MRTESQKSFQKEFIDFFSSRTGCSCQYNNSPCNTCFFSLMDKFKVPDETANRLWKALLVIRGDYKEKDFRE